MAYNGPLPQVVNAGGTGDATLTNHGVLVGAATSPVTQLGVGTNGQVLVGASAADPAFATLTSSDSSISFTTGANTLSLQVAGGTTAIKTITGNSGGAESPSAGNFNVLGTGSITVAGSANTETVQLTGLTNHNVLIGAGSATITNVAPSATSGIPLVSNGASSDPSFTTAVVAGGGTGNTTFTAYSVIAAGTTATGAFQNVSGVGTSGQILTSNGASALPTWQTGPSLAISLAMQVFTSSGTYTPTSGMVYCIIECMGGGGGGGGSGSATASFNSGGGGGAGGNYSRKLSTAAAIGASQTVTIGAAGAAGASGNHAGGNGGQTSVGAICVANGGLGGGGSSGGAAVQGGGVGAAGTGDFQFYGSTGPTSSFANGASVVFPSPGGGNSFFGVGGQTFVGNTTTTGGVAAGYGGGGGGGTSYNAGGSAAGGAGTAGVVVITEYI